MSNIKYLVSSYPSNRLSRVDAEIQVRAQCPAPHHRLWIAIGSDDYRGARWVFLGCSRASARPKSLVVAEQPA